MTAPEPLSCTLRNPIIPHVVSVCGSASVGMSMKSSYPHWERDPFEYVLWGAPLAALCLKGGGVTLF